MPSLEEMLAAIAADDDGEDTETEGTASGAPQVRSNSAIKQIRDHAKKLERELERERKAREELAAWKEQRVVEDNTNALKGAGLSPRQAEVFLKFYGDVTPENIQEFRRDVLGTAVDEGQRQEEFRPTGAAESRDAFGREEKPLTREELNAIADKDPAKAVELMRSGKVQFR